MFVGIWPRLTSPLPLELVFLSGSSYGGQCSSLLKEPQIWFSLLQTRSCLGLSVHCTRKINALMALACPGALWTRVEWGFPQVSSLGWSQQSLFSLGLCPSLAHAYSFLVSYSCWPWRESWTELRSRGRGFLAKESIRRALGGQPAAAQCCSTGPWGLVAV